MLECTQLLCAEAGAFQPDAIKAVGVGVAFGGGQGVREN
jgi:hypothetical protein